MVVILSGKENSAESEIMAELNGFEAISLIGKTDININKGVVIIADQNKRLKNVKLSKSLTGICSDENLTALNIFKKNCLPIITCGMGSKNTVTVSSISEKSLMLSLQRNIRDINGKVIEPLEIKAEKKGESFFPIMAAETAKLILGGV